jgi:hypothetical protein
MLDAAMHHTGARMLIAVPATKDGRRWMHAAARRYIVIDGVRNLV